MIARLIMVVVALGVAGCTSPSKVSHDPPSSSQPGPAAPERPRDRDGDAVREALRRIDLCAVVEPATTAAPHARQPMACEVGDSANVTIVPLGHEERVTLPGRVVGGAKAYVDLESARCSVLLPISFELAVSFTHSTSCAAATELAAASATVLADPDTVRADPRWDPCTVLAETLDPTPDWSNLFLGSESGICQYLGVPAEHEAMLSFADLPPTTSPRPATIGGTEVQVFENGDNCAVYWRQRPFPSRFAQTPDYPVLVFSTTCAYSTELAMSAIKVLAGTPPAGGTPQHPLLYSPHEPDGPFLGECAYVADADDARECEPYRETPVPDGPSTVPNAQVMCAVAAKAVAEHFGELRPVAVSAENGSCHFVEPDRTIVVTFAITPGRVVAESGDRAVTIDRHPGTVTADTDSYDYRVSTADDDERDGAVELTVRTGPVAAPDTPLPAGTDTKAEAMLADILETY